MAPVPVTQEKDHKGNGQRGAGDKTVKTLVGRALLPSRPPPRPTSQVPAPPSQESRELRPPPLGPSSRGRFGPPPSRRPPPRTSGPPRPPRENLPPPEEISSSLLLPDDGASGTLPGVEAVEELSGSLLLDDPSLVLDDPTVVREAPFAAFAAPAAPAREHRPARQDHVARTVHHGPAGEKRVLPGR